MHSSSRRFSLRPLCWYLVGALAPAPALALDPGALPEGASAVAGSAKIHANGRNMVIDQHSNKLITNWRSFDIGSRASVRFDQPSASSVALNRVTGGDASRIYGSLSANGRVFLVNPNGVYFAPGASVDVGGLVASSLNIADKRFLAGDYVFESAGAAGDVVNEGRIRASGGEVALVGARVVNRGRIEAPRGGVALAAGGKVTLDFDGDGLISVDVDRAALAAAVSNTGAISADGGTVVLRAQARDALYATVVSNSGVIRARSIGQRGGRVVLDGGGDGVTVNGGEIDVKGAGSGERGGTAHVLGDKVAVTGRIDASGQAGGGTILVGGGFQGKGAQRNASAAFIDRQAVLRADATDKGDGGTVVVWSDDTTRFYGEISARGGARGGDGGLVETSGKEWLDASGRVDASAALGAAGTWLLDPRNVTISNDATSGGSLEDGTAFDPIANNAVVNVGSINDSLNNGTSVTITTGTTGTQAGDIVVAADAVIDKTAGGEASLTLKAARHITVNGTIRSSSEKLHVILNSRAEGGPVGYVNLNGATIVTNGGDFVAGGGLDPLTGYAIGAGSGTTNGVRVFNSTIATGAGNITLNGQAGTAAAAGVSLPSGSASTITTTSGDIVVRGQAQDGNAVLVQGTHTIQTSDGSISVTGASDTGNGLRLGSTNSDVLVGTGTGSIHLQGETQGAGLGISVDPNFRLETSGGSVALVSLGDLTMAGTPIRTAGGGVSLTTSGTARLNGLDVQSGGGDIAVRAGAHIVFSEASGSSLRSQGGDVVLNSRSGGAAQGYVDLRGATVVSAGGDILVGGGANPATGYAIGSSTTAGGQSTNGVRFGDTTLDSGAGDIVVNGQAGTAGVAGVSLASGTTSAITTTSGDVVLRGRSENGNAVLVQGAQTIRTGSGSIILSGVAEGGNGLRLGSSSSDVRFETGTGDIRLSGATQTGLGISIDPNFGMKTGGGRVALVATGDLELSGTPIRTAGGDVSLTSSGTARLRGLDVQTGGGRITVKAGAHIAFSSASGSSLRSQGGDVVLNSRSGGAAQGYVDLRGATVVSAGGDIVVGGGADPATGYAVGAGTTSGGQSTNGVRFGGTVLDSGAGDIVVNGRGGTAAATGVSLANSSTNRIVSTSGNITLRGASHASAAATGSGLIIQTGDHAIESGSGRITLQGASAGDGDGVRIGTTGTSRIRIVTGGDIVVDGRSAGQGDGVQIGGGDLLMAAEGRGALTVRGRAVGGNGVTVGPVGSTSTTTLRTTDGRILLDGQSVDGYGMNLYASATPGDLSGRGTAIVESTGGDIDIRGTSVSSVGLRNSPISTGDTRVSTVTGNITLTGRSRHDDAIQIQPSLNTATGNNASAVYAVTGGGNITLRGDRIALAGNRTRLYGNGGTLTFAPLTPGVTMGFGTGAEGQLYFSNTALRAIHGDWRAIVVGSPTAGWVEVGATLPENILVTPSVVNMHTVVRPGDPRGAEARLATADAWMQLDGLPMLAALDGPLRLERDAEALPAALRAATVPASGPAQAPGCEDDCEDDEEVESDGE